MIVPHGNTVAQVSTYLILKNDTYARWLCEHHWLIEPSLATKTGRVQPGMEHSFGTQDCGEAAEFTEELLLDELVVFLALFAQRMPQ
jgi:hypothetical protein